MSCKAQTIHNLACDCVIWWDGGRGVEVISEPNEGEVQLF